MKRLSTALALLLPFLLDAQQHHLEKIWETDTIVAVPESVLPDPDKKLLYVSLIDGNSWDIDDKGGVARLSPDGKQYEAGWISGLNAPKGMGHFGNRLYVADIYRVVVIDIKKGKIEKEIRVDSANGLNDITVDSRGVVYVSDSRAGKVYRIENDKPALYKDNMKGANGLKAVPDGLYILANKAVLKADLMGNITKITDLPNGGDGVELADNGDLVVSEWVGYIYYVYANGEKELLLDTHDKGKNTADISYDQANHILYVPTFNGKTVVAYRLVEGAAPAVLMMNGSRLATWKAQWQQKDPATVQMVNDLKKQADHLLSLVPHSVMDKASTPPGGNKHDYMSQAPYFWYDSSKPNGLPYLRRDGQRNPEIYKITDDRYMGELENASKTLALAWYFTGEEKYSGKAVSLLKHWFLDDSTKMNPNFDYAQAVPGVNTGRGTGLIEARAFAGIADAISLLKGSSALAPAIDNALRQWYTEFLAWMLDSRNGKDEHAAKNNHGTWYLVQAIDYALFTGNSQKALELAEEGKRKMDEQVEGDGKMPLELARTNGLGYSTFNLQAWFRLASLAQKTGTDLWQYRNKNGAGLKIALDWLKPYALGEKKWEYQQISKYKESDFYSLLPQAAAAYNDKDYYEMARKANALFFSFIY